MSIVTLLSDFGSSDFHIARIKAALWKRVEDLKIVDISHDIEPFSVMEAAFVLQNTYRSFPDKTIHLIGVDAEAHDHQKHVLVKQNNQFFIGADNGIFSLIDDSPIQQITTIKHEKSLKSINPMEEVFPDIVYKILTNKPLTSIGKNKKEVKPWKRLTPDMSDLSEIIGHVIYIDRFGNLLTDVNQKIFEEKSQGRSFTIYASSAKITTIHHKYSEVMPRDNTSANVATNVGKALAVFNSMGILEIALYKSNPDKGGSASTLLGMNVGDSFKIKFD